MSIERQNAEGLKISDIAHNPEGVVVQLNRLEDRVGELNSALADLVSTLSPVMYTRSWPELSGLAEDFADESCSLLKNIYGIQTDVSHATRLVKTLIDELNL